ncbi:MAG: MASE1 domain-containing protein [Sandaracinaceae bacterium]|nr:MASE1 domain-containing protein [Sandaracinaceae bacterium]
MSTSGAVPASILHGRRLLAANALLALTYVALGRVGLEIAHYQANATLVWPPTGVALAALVLWGPRLWPGLFVGAFLVNLSVPTPLAGALGIALGNTLEAVLGSLLLVRVARFDAAFARTRDVLTFLAIGAFGCTVLSATIGTATLGAIGALEGRDAGLVWLIWWLGDVGGAVLVAPVVFVLARGRPRWSALAARAESWIVLSLVIGSSVAAFGPWLAEGWLPAARALLLLLFPLLAWAGMRLGPRGAVTAAALAGAIAAIATAAGVGPFAGPSVHESLLVLWAYGTGLGACAAILAAAVAERGGRGGGAPEGRVGAAGHRGADGARAAPRDDRRARERRRARLQQHPDHRAGERRAGGRRRAQRHRARPRRHRGGGGARRRALQAAARLRGRERPAPGGRPARRARARRAAHAARRHPQEDRPRGRGGRGVGARRSPADAAGDREPRDQRGRGHRRERGGASGCACACSPRRRWRSSARTSRPRRSRRAGSRWRSRTTAKAWTRPRRAASSIRSSPRRSTGAASGSRRCSASCARTAARCSSRAGRAPARASLCSCPRASRATKRRAKRRPASPPTRPC